MTLEDHEIDTIVDRISDRIKSQDHPCCALSDAEVDSLKGILKTKGWAVKAMLVVFTGLVLYAMQDLYMYLKTHLYFGR